MEDIESLFHNKIMSGKLYNTKFYQGHYSSYEYDLANKVIVEIFNNILHWFIDLLIISTD